MSEPYEISGFHDPRLRSPEHLRRLLKILEAAYETPQAAVDAARRAGLPGGRLHMKESAHDMWQSIVTFADNRADDLGSFDRLLSGLIDDLKETRFKEALVAWGSSRGFREIGQAAQEIRSLLARISAAQQVEDWVIPATALSAALQDLARILAETKSLGAIFEGLDDGEDQLLLARDTTRRALAAVGALLYEARDVKSFLRQSAAVADPRADVDRRVASYVLVEHAMRQRAVVDQAVSAVLEILIAAVPTALTRHQDAADYRPSG